MSALDIQPIAPCTVRTERAIRGSGTKGGRKRRLAAILGIAACSILSPAATLRASDSEVRESLSREIEITQESAAAAAHRQGGEVFHFRWKLGGLLGVLAGLFVPDDGDALVTFVPVDQGRKVEIQLLLTAPKRDGEYFLYGAEVDTQSGATESVWSSWVFRDEGKDREQDVHGSQVIDFASVLYRLRRHPPEVTTPMTIWNNGKTYPVEMEPIGVKRRKLGEKKIEVRGFSVLGVEVDGKSTFDEKLFLYFLDDEIVTPAQIVGKRGLIKVKASLVGPGGE